MTTMNIPVVTEPPQKSLGELFGDLTQETATLVRQEVTLAQKELMQKAGRIGKDIGLLITGGALAYAGLIVFLFGVATGLIAVGMAAWLAYLLVGIIVTAIGGWIANKGLSQLREMDPIPHQTVATLQEDIRWAKEQGKR
jgi:hypothetical protein